MGKRTNRDAELELRRTEVKKVKRRIQANDDEYLGYGTKKCAYNQPPAFLEAPKETFFTE